MLHFIYNYRLTLENSFRQEATALTFTKTQLGTIKTKLLVSKELAIPQEQIHDGENACVDRLNKCMQAEDVSEQLTTIEETILKLPQNKGKKLLRLALKLKLEFFDYTCCRTIKTCFT
jgi:hypothetical protein